MNAAPDVRPLGIWDARGVEGAWQRYMTEAAQWAVDHIADPVSTYRVEFYLIDAPFAVVYRYECDKDGYIRHGAGGAPVRLEPVTHLLDELPPAHLLAI